MLQKQPQSADTERALLEQRIELLKQQAEDRSEVEKSLRDQTEKLLEAFAEKKEAHAQELDKVRAEYERIITNLKTDHELDLESYKTQVANLEAVQQAKCETITELQSTLQENRERNAEKIEGLEIELRKQERAF